MRRFRKATIKDVAARAGVSTTTVSNFVSGNTGICSPETGERIEQAVIALQYVPTLDVARLQATFSRQHVALQIGVLAFALLGITTFGPAGVAPFIYYRF